MAGLLGIGLAGCAALAPSLPQAPAAEAGTAPRPYVSSIDIGGRISVLYQQAGRDEALHGAFTWSQQPDRTLVTLLSPLGQTLAEIDVTPQRARFTEAGQPPREAPDPDALALSVLGWPLPVSGLKDWLQGVGRDAQGKPFTASPVNATVTTADGWTLHYLTWEDVPPSPAPTAPTSPTAPTASPATSASQALPADPPQPATVRPRRIDLQRYTPEAGNVTIKLALDQWQPAAAASTGPATR